LLRPSNRNCCGWVFFLQEQVFLSFLFFCSWFRPFQKELLFSHFSSTLCFSYLCFQSWFACFACACVFPSRFLYKCHDLSFLCSCFPDATWLG
jgi:hypothetical protein